MASDGLLVSLCESTLGDGRPTAPSPDHAGAACVLAGFSRISGQRIVLDREGAECTVLGLIHRRSVERRVSLPVALGLARRGIRTVVRVREP